MKKLLVFITTIGAVAAVSFGVNKILYAMDMDFNITPSQTIMEENIKNDSQIKDTNEEKEFGVYVDSEFKESFDTFEEAVIFAENYEKSLIKQKNNSKYIWDNYPAYEVFLNDNELVEFYTFEEARNFVRDKERAFIYYKKDSGLVWTNVGTIKPKHIIFNVPKINQLPELPRGCEVTSLNMLLKFKNIDVDKLELAQKIKKDDSEKQIIDGKIYYGNPNNGFVGDMYSFATNGLGVYHKPIHKLLTEYFPYSSIDITGGELKDVLFFINRDIPVWVIVNSTYKPLAENNFQTWHTKDGEIKITTKEHSVLITGYDENYIYFNDPLNLAVKAPLKEFEDAWIQMGKQAVTTTF